MVTGGNFILFSWPDTCCFSPKNKIESCQLCKVTESMNSLCRLTARLRVGAILTTPIASAPCLKPNIREAHWPAGNTNKPGRQCLWRIIHYPEKYTVEPLRVTNLAGRDPKTGNFAD